MYRVVCCIALFLICSGCTTYKIIPYVNGRPEPQINFFENRFERFSLQSSIYLVKQTGEVEYQNYNKKFSIGDERLVITLKIWNGKKQPFALFMKSKWKSEYVQEILALNSKKTNKLTLNLNLAYGLTTISFFAIDNNNIKFLTTPQIIIQKRKETS